MKFWTARGHELFFPAFLSALFVFAYAFIFYLSADTPLIDASFASLANLFGFIVVIAFVVALLITLIGSLLNFLSKLSQGSAGLTKKIIVIFILFFGFLLLAENWSYSLFQSSLKTGEAIWMKGLFLAAAIFLAYQFSGAVIKLGSILSNHSWKTLVIILIISVIIISTNLMQELRTPEFNPDRVNLKNNYNVVILSSDGINAREMSMYGSQYETTPFLNSVKNEFMLFENAYSNNQNTTGSVISMLTGMLPLTTKVVYPPDILKGADSLRSLPKILGDAGYYRTLWAVPHYADAVSQNMVGAFDINNIRASFFLDEVASYLNLSSLQRWFFIRALKDLSNVAADVFYIKELSNPFAQVDETTVNQDKSPTTLTDEMRLNNVLEDITDASNKNIPFFIMTHFMKSHGAKFKPKNRVFSKNIQQIETWMLGFYRDSILDFDQLIETVYSKLKETGQLENTILVITSDHGMKYDNRNRIPLLIRLPGAKNNGNYLVNSQLIDIAPTIVEFLGFDIPDWMEGDSLLFPDQVPVDRYIFMTGVRYNKTAGKIWIREAEKTPNFASGNAYSVIYCDYYMKSYYPIKFTLAKLKDHIGSASCKQKSEQEIVQEAQQFVEKSLSN